MNCIYAENLRDREQERQNFIEEIANINNKLEEREKFYQNLIFQTENSNQLSLDKKLAEFWNFAQDNEQKLLCELQEFDDKLKSAERDLIIAKNEFETKQFSFEKEKLDLLQMENQLKMKIKENEQNQNKIQQEFQRKIAELEYEISEKIEENQGLYGQINELLKNILILKGQLNEANEKINKINEFYDESQEKIRSNTYYQLSPNIKRIYKSINISPSKFIKNIENSSNKIENSTNKIKRSFEISKEKTENPNRISLKINEISKNKEDFNNEKDENSKKFSKKQSSKLNKNIEQLLKEDKNEEIKETISISNFDDLESNSSNSILQEDQFKIQSGLNNSTKKNDAILRENREIMEKNEILFLFLRDKEEEISRLNEKIKNLQSLSEVYEKEISDLRKELKVYCDKFFEKSKNFSENNANFLQNDESSMKIIELERKLVQTKEEWANLVNFLNEELILAEKTAVEAKIKYVESASQKEFFQYKYNSLLNQIKKK